MNSLTSGNYQFRGKGYEETLTFQHEPEVAFGTPKGFWDHSLSDKYNVAIHL
jgi:hypothetical protein